MPPSLFLKCCAPWQGLCLCCEPRWRRSPGWPDLSSSEFRSGQPLHSVHQSCCSWFWHLHLITYAWFRWGCRSEYFKSSGVGLPDRLFKIFNKIYTLFPDPPDALQPRETERRVVLQTGVPAEDQGIQGILHFSENVLFVHLSSGLEHLFWHFPDGFQTHSAPASPPAVGLWKLRQGRLRFLGSSIFPGRPFLLPRSANLRHKAGAFFRCCSGHRCQLSCGRFDLPRKDLLPGAGNGSLGGIHILCKLFRTDHRPPIDTIFLSDPLTGFRLTDQVVTVTTWLLFAVISSDEFKKQNPLLKRRGQRDTNDIDYLLLSSLISYTLFWRDFTQKNLEEVCELSYLRLKQLYHHQGP